MNLLLSGIIAVLALQTDCVQADCGVVTKEEWGSLKVKHVQYLPRPVELVIIQETTTRNCVPGNRVPCDDLVKVIQSRHVEVVKYNDIGFSFLIGGDLKVYEGAGWLHVGNHSLGYNSMSIGIAFIGSYDDDIPSTRMMNVAKKFLKCGVENGHLTPDYQVVAHSQLIASKNPGKELYNEIITLPEWEKDVTYIKFKAFGTRNAR